MSDYKSEIASLFNTLKQPNLGDILTIIPQSFRIIEINSHPLSDIFPLNFAITAAVTSYDEIVDSQPSELTVADLDVFKSSLDSTASSISSDAVVSLVKGKFEDGFIALNLIFGIANNGLAINSGLKLTGKLSNFLSIKLLAKMQADLTEPSAPIIGLKGKFFLEIMGQNLLTGSIAITNTGIALAVEASPLPFLQAGISGRLDVAGNLDLTADISASILGVSLGTAKVKIDNDSVSINAKIIGLDIGFTLNTDLSLTGSVDFGFGINTSIGPISMNGPGGIKLKLPALSINAGFSGLLKITIKAPEQFSGRIEGSFYFQGKTRELGEFIVSRPPKSFEDLQTLIINNIKSNAKRIFADLFEGMLLETLKELAKAVEAIVQGVGEGLENLSQETMQAVQQLQSALDVTVDLGLGGIGGAGGGPAIPDSTSSYSGKGHFISRNQRWRA